MKPMRKPMLVLALLAALVAGGATAAEPIWDANKVQIKVK